VDTYKCLHPLIETREYQAYGEQSFFAKNHAAKGADEDIGMREDSE